jgi:hypothetical protein
VILTVDRELTVNISGTGTGRRRQRQQVHQWRRRLIKRWQPPPTAALAGLAIYDHHQSKKGPAMNKPRQPKEQALTVDEGNKITSPVIKLGKVQLLLALVGLLVLAGAYWINLLHEALAVLLRIPYQPLVIVLGVAALALAALALLPRRPVQVATNVLVASARCSSPSNSCVSPLRRPTGGYRCAVGRGWETVAAGRSVLLSHHYSYSTPQVRDALDFVQIVDGRGYDGDPKRVESWYGFGEPVLAPADGRVISVSDIHPDEPIGATGVTPPYGNHIVLEIGNHRYAVTRAPSFS